MPQNIKGIKRTENQRELVALYTIADVFFNPTYEDNFPTTNLEALACGTPVITYDTGGSPEEIRNIEKNNAVTVGEIIRKKSCRETDLNEVANRLTKWMETDSKKLQPDEYSSNLDSKQCFDNYLALYEKIGRK